MEENYGLRGTLEMMSGYLQLIDLDLSFPVTKTAYYFYTISITVIISKCIVITFQFLP